MNEQSCARLEACRHRMISCLSLVFISCGMMLCVCQPASADILASGDVTPDVNTWDATTAGYVGYSSDATLTVDNGSDLLADTFMIARNSGVTGVATVTGTDSTVTCSGRLTAGHQGSGTLNITDGGAFSCKETRVGGSSVAGSTGVVNVNGVNSTWTSGYIQIGYEASNGTVNVTNNGTVTTASYVRVGSSAGSSGLLRVDGNGSSLTSTSTSGLYVGHNGDGTIQITNGGTVRNYGARIGSEVGATGAVTVDGAGSNWTMTGSSLYVGYNGTGTLTITNGGLVSVATTLTIDNSGAGNSFINMDMNGVLALFGDADDSLNDFLALVSGTDAIRYWDADASEWADITTATYGVDYTLSYQDEGDLAGYTLLTVVPEPTTLSLLLLGALSLYRKRKRA